MWRSGIPIEKESEQSERVLQDFMYVALRWNLSDIIMPQIVCKALCFWLDEAKAHE